MTDKDREKLNAMLDEALEKQTKDSWNKFLEETNSEEDNLFISKDED